MPVARCRICLKLIKRSKTMMKVYPKDYDFSCCNSCNEEAENQD